MSPLEFPMIRGSLFGDGACMEQTVLVCFSADCLAVRLLDFSISSVLNPTVSSRILA